MILCRAAVIDRNCDPPIRACAGEVVDGIGHWCKVHAKDPARQERLLLLLRDDWRQVLDPQVPQVVEAPGKVEAPQKAEAPKPRRARQDSAAPRERQERIRSLFKIPTADWALKRLIPGE